MYTPLAISSILMDLSSVYILLPPKCIPSAQIYFLNPRPVYLVAYLIY